jgi:tRNA(Ile)-lysidine synthase
VRSLDLPQGLRVTRILQRATVERLHHIRRDKDKEQGCDIEERGNDKREAVLPVPGEVAVAGTGWIARAEMLAGELLEQVKDALRREDWPEVWHLLPATRYAVYIDAQSVGETLRVRTRRPGDRLQPLGMRHEKKVQDILVDEHIVRTERDAIPLFISESHCIWLAGVTLAERVRLTSRTEHIVRLSVIQD